MTPQQIVGLGVRLVALWLALRGGTWLFQSFAARGDAAFSGIAAQLVPPGVSYLLAGLALWNAPMWVAHKLVPRTAHDNVLNVSLFDAARVGCALIGLWITADTMQNIVWFIISAVVATGSDSVFSTLTKEHRIALAVDVFQVVLGLFLVFRSQWFARLVAK